MAAAEAGQAGEQVKAACRDGVPVQHRRALWLSLAGVTSDATQDYMRACAQVFGTHAPLPDKLLSIPFLGVDPYTVPQSCVHLVQQPSFRMSAAHDRVVCLLSKRLALRHCPMVPQLAILLLQFLSEAETFAVVLSLYQRGGSGAVGLTGGSSASLRMFLSSPAQEAAFVQTFISMVKPRFPKLHAHIEALVGAGHTSVSDVFLAWFRGFFAGWLPNADVLRVVDLFLSEGPKVLLRLGLAWLKVRKRALKQCADGGAFEMCLRDWVVGGPTAKDAVPYRFLHLQQEAFALRGVSKVGIHTSMTAFVQEGAGAGVAVEPAWSAPLLLGPCAGLARPTTPSGTVALALFQPPVHAPSTTPGPSDASWSALLPSLSLPFPEHPPAALQAWAGGPGREGSQCLAALPGVPALHALLPAAHKDDAWKVVYSSQRHPGSLATLYSHTAGLAPCIVVLNLRLTTTEPPPPAEAGGDAGSAGQLRSDVALAFFCRSGLPAPGQGLHGAGQWGGTLADFAFQLAPQTAHFPTTASVGQAKALTGVGEGMLVAQAYRQPFLKASFVRAGAEAAEFGGSLPAPGQTAALPPALTLPKHFEGATVSRVWLEDLGVLLPPDTPASTTAVPVSVGCVEALMLQDGLGQPRCVPTHQAPGGPAMAAAALGRAAAADTAYEEATAE